MFDAIALAVLQVANVTTHPILGGEPAPDELAVVALTGLNDHPYCSGVLVAPDVVVTAAHCVVDQERTVRAPHRVRFVAPDGDELDLEVAWVEVSPLYDRPALIADLALIGLASPAPVPPIPVLPPARDHAGAGTAARFIGFGFTELGATGAVGERRWRDAALARRDGDVLYYGEVTCNGDSGGAVLVDDGGTWHLAGVVSAGPIGCYFYGLASAVSPHAAWIAASAEARPAVCADDGRCVPGCDDADCRCVADGSCGACGGDPGLPCDGETPPPGDGGGCAAGGGGGGAVALLVAALALLRCRARDNGC